MDLRHVTLSGPQSKKEVNIYFCIHQLSELQVRVEGTRNVIHRSQCRDRSEVTGSDQSLQLLACGTLGGEVRNH